MKWATKSKIWAVFPRQLISCWGLTMAPRGFFVHVDMLHKPLKFPFTTSIWELGLQFWSFQGGAAEPFCHSQTNDLYRMPLNMLRSTSPDAHVKFHDCRSFPCPSKTSSYFMAKDVSLWQRRLTMRQFQVPLSNYLKSDACNFLFPVGGTMTQIQFDTMDLFRVGLLSSTKCLNLTRPCMLDLWPFKFSWVFHGTPAWPAPWERTDPCCSYWALRWVGGRLYPQQSSPLMCLAALTHQGNCRKGPCYTVPESWGGWVASCNHANHLRYTQP